MTDEGQGRGSRRPLAITLAVLAALALIWIVGTVPSGGPDEPVHLVRGAALARGDVTGDRFAGQGRVFELPAWVGHPDHGCFSLHENQPASCATGLTRPDGDQLLVTTSWRYPVWGHLPPGLGSHLPAAIGNQASRVFDSVIPIALIGAALALARRRSLAATGAVALAVTPMAWFSIIVVNPSGMAIAGGLALWVGLLHTGWTQRSHVGASRLPLPDRLSSWTIAAGWAAAVLPRRDGMIWASLIVGICAMAGVVDLRALARRSNAGPMVLVGLSTLATLAWAATSDTPSSRLLLATPLLPLIGIALHKLWCSPALAYPARRAGAVALGLVVAALGSFGAMAIRRGGFDSEVFGRLVAQSGINLEEAIGLLGWLDAPLPRTALFLWFVALGVLVGAGLTSGGSRGVALAGAVVVIGVVAAWVLEMNQGTTTGTYWQGRYYLPLLVGVPVLVGWSVGGDSQGSADEPNLSVPNDRGLMVATLSAALLVMTMAFGASMRRWGVGTSGSLDPRSWDTYGSLVSPVALLVAHGAVAVVAVLAASRLGAIEPPTLAESGFDMPEMDTVVTNEH